MLKTFEWSEELSVGVPDMDHQHHQLVDMINELIATMDTDDLSKILTSYKALGSFVVKHFNDEEEFMEKIGFESLGVHKQIHIQLLDKVGVFQAEMEQGRLDKLKLVEFLKMWLRSHIMGIDAKYGVKYRENAA